MDMFVFHRLIHSCHSFIFGKRLMTSCSELVRPVRGGYPIFFIVFLMFNWNYMVLFENRVPPNFHCFQCGFRILHKKQTMIPEDNMIIFKMVFKPIQSIFGAPWWRPEACPTPGLRQLVQRALRRELCKVEQCSCWARRRGREQNMHKSATSSNYM